MNYQHHYHAGSAADVFKHAVLLALLEQFKQKDKPFCFVDFYAGSGIYNLSSSNQEWQTGVRRIQQHHLKHPLLKTYQKLTANRLAYPGSPALARFCLRTQDEMIAVEKNETALQFLKDYFYRDTQVHIHHTDAQTAVKALLPPQIRRGMVLIDPPYEDIDEFSNLVTLTQQALNKWATATYLLWYPIKSRQIINRFHHRLKENIIAEMLALELCPWPDDLPVRLNGSGLIVINPPWQFETMIRPVMVELLTVLKQHDTAKQSIVNLKHE